MRSNPVKKKLREGGVSLGTMVFEFASTGVARIAAAAGAEFVLFDMEHTGWGLDTIRTLLATARGADTVPMVRVPAADYHFLARALDVGAMGLMVPMVEGGEQARRIVQSAKYPPAGRRGAAFGIAHDDYRPGDALESMRSANDELLLIAQIETVRGLETVEEIAGIDGIDVLWIGHNDLTNSMGIPGQFDHQRYRDAVTRILEVTRKHGKAAGFMATSVEQGSEMLARGFRIVSYGGDIWLYQRALRDGLAGLRAALPGRR